MAQAAVDTGSGLSNLICSPVDLTLCVPRGVDAAVASLDGSGHLQTSYGRGDGFAVVNNTEYSNDKIDAILVETSDKIVLAGSSGRAIFDYFLERLTANGSPLTLHSGRMGAWCRVNTTVHRQNACS
jgi:hypothetical protein